MTDAEKLKQLIDKLKAGGKLTSQERKFVAQTQRAPEFYSTLEEIAAHYGVVRSALRRWEEVTPTAFVKGPQGYDARLIAEARRKFLATGKNVRLNEGDVSNAKENQERETKVDALPGATHETLEELKIRERSLMCSKLADQVDLIRRITIKRSIAEREARAFAMGVRDGLLRIGPETCYRVSGATPAEASEIITDAISAVLNKMDGVDFEKFQAALDGEGNDTRISTRLPAAREKNGRQGAN